MPKPKIYPKQPYIGVDCSGQPKSPPLIAVATRWTRHEHENKWIVKVSADRIVKYSATRDWEEKIYAVTIFKAIDKILVPFYEIHIDEDFQQTKNQRKIRSFLEYLFGCFHNGDPLLEKPKISFHTKRNSKYVWDAHLKHCLVTDKKMRIDEKSAGIDHLMKMLE
jgi:hypothetical protein